MTKQEARALMRQKRKELSDREREGCNKRIRERLLGLEEMKNGKFFFPYVSCGTEVDTMELIALLLRQGRNVAVPRVLGDEMEFYKISGLGQLKPGYQGILEPPETYPVQEREGVMLLPGLAFDRKRNRAGYGGGYYDRYLAKIGEPSMITIAIAYDFQVVESLSVEAYDRRPDILVTDRQVIR